MVGFEVEQMIMPTLQGSHVPLFIAQVGVFMCLRLSIMKCDAS